MVPTKFSAVVLVFGLLFAASSGASAPAAPRDPASPLMQTAYVAPQAAAPATPTAQSVVESASASEHADMSPLAMLLLGLAAVGIGVFRNNKYSD